MPNLKQFRIRGLFYLLAILILSVGLAACGSGAEPQAPSAEVVVTRIVEQEVEVIVTQIVETEVEKEVVVTSTPEPTVDPSSDPINLRFTIWSANEQHLAMLNGFADEYKAEHPNVTVQFDVIPFDDYATKLAVQLSGTNPPDAGWMPGALALPFIEAGALADITDATRNNSEYNYDDLVQSKMVLYLPEDGTVRGVPFSTSPWFIYFNRDLFEQAGIETPDVLAERGEWTFEKLAETAKAVKDATGVYGYQEAQGWLDTTRLHGPTMWMRAFGGEIWNEDRTECLINSPGSIAAIQFYHDMLFKDESAVPPGAVADFTAGDVAMSLSLLSQSARLSDATFDWGIVRIPEGPAGEIGYVGQSAIVAFERSRNKAAAADFVSFMTNEQNVTTMAQFFPPIRTSVLESDAFATVNPLIAPEDMKDVVGWSIANSQIETTHPEFPKVLQAIQSQFDLLWVPDADVTAIANGACEAIAPYLNN